MTNKFIVMRWDMFSDDWDIYSSHDDQQSAIEAMESKLNDDWEDMIGWKWESNAMIESGINGAAAVVMHHETKEIAFAFNISKIKLPTMK